MTRIRWRRAASVYLALFFLAIAAAPHHHLNGLEDLLLDQRSDSGTIIESSSITGPPGTQGFQSARVLRDVPCPACFLGDFACDPAAVFFLVAKLAPLPLTSDPPALATPELLAADTSSRSPPPIS